MALQTGTHGLQDLLANESQSVIDYGMENIQPVLEAELAAHNAVMQDAVGALAVQTTERAETYGASLGGEMIETDEYARVPTQKQKGRGEVAYPLRQFQYAIGWTNEWMRKNTPADLARAVLGAERAHRIAVITKIKQAIFGASNYTFYDYLTDDLGLTVRRLLNADSQAIPVGPNGESFNASSHTHYDAIEWSTATSDAKDAAIEALVNDVVEHGHGAGLVVYVNKADESKIRALTDFEAYLPAQIIRGTQADRAAGTLDTTRVDNRAIGVLAASGAEVWVKPWVPANYVFAYASGDPDKPLKVRVAPDVGSPALRIVAEIPSYPLFAQYMASEFGFGAFTRTNGAVLYLGDSTYTDPTF